MNATSAVNFTIRKKLFITDSIISHENFIDETADDENAIESQDALQLLLSCVLLIKEKKDKKKKKAISTYKHYETSYGK